MIPPAIATRINQANSALNTKADDASLLIAETERGLAELGANTVFAYKSGSLSVLEYTKYHGAWRLCFADPTMERTALLQCSRSIRIWAATQMEAFVEAYAQHLESLTVAE